MANLREESFKKVNTVGDLMKWLRKLPKDAMKDKISMYSDEEGNEENSILCIEFHEDGVTLIPWERRG